MSVKPRTIDNLGLDSSIRYAKDQERLDQRFINESNWVSRKTEVSVTKPYIASEFDQLFSLGKTVQWALFDAPPNYEAHTRSLFSYQLIPSLGSEEKQEADNEKISALEDALHKKGGGQGQQNDEEEEERQALLSLLQCIRKLDKTLGMINARRNQYQRG